MPATPLRGDRSAWDALYYPQLHTDDINETTGIHWTADGIRSLVIPGSSGTSWLVNEDHSDECDNTTTTFNTLYSFSSETTSVYLNGLHQRLGIDYLEATSLDQIIMGNAPFEGDELIFDYQPYEPAVVIPPTPPVPPPVDPPAPPTPPTPPAGGTIWTVPLTTSVIDGFVSPWNGVKPGDIIELAPGTRGTLNIKNFSGTASSPIIIRNGNGQVVMNTTSGWVGFWFQNLHYIRFTGYAYSQTYGIKVQSAVRFGILGNNKVDNIEIDHVSVHYLGSNSISFHIITGPENYDYDGDSEYDVPTVNRSNYVQSNIKLHDCYADGSTTPESMAVYIGNSNYKTLTTEVTLTNIEVYNNIFENMNDKVVQVGSCVSGLKIYGNTIRNSCLTITEDVQAINVNPGIGGLVYNNWIIDCLGRGITYMADGGTIYNNIIIRCGRAGTYWDGGIAIFQKDGFTTTQNMNVFHNTIISPVGTGISISTGMNRTNRVQNNIIANPGGSYVSATSGTNVVDHNLQVATVAGGGFLDSANDDYHLDGGSAAIGYGTDLSAYSMILDKDNITRPQGGWDAGAYEFMSSYYVDYTGGNDSNDGMSSTSAWKTMDKVNASTFVPGDTILFKRGEIWYHQLTPVCNGSIGNYITYGAYGTGVRPIIDGSSGHMCALAVGEGYHHMRFESIDFTGSTQTNYSSVMAYSHDLYFYDCIFRDGGNSGFSAWTNTGASIYNVVVDSCEAYNNTDNGILISSVTGMGGPHDCEIKYCVCHHNGTDPWADHGIYPRYGVTVHDCVCYSNPVGAGIKVNSESIHSPFSPVVYNNIVYDNFIGLYCVHQNAIIYNNLAYHNEINVNFDGDSHDIIFIYNTIVNSWNGHAFNIQASIANTIIKNNLIIQDRAVQPRYIFGGTYSDTLEYFAANCDIDYNTYYTDTNSSTDIFADSSGALNWTEWKALTGSPDANSTFLTSLPQVVARYTNMHPTDGGNIKNKGIAITGYNADQDGNTRESPPTPGCYEEAVA
jgi:hypothetical protein